MMLIVPLQPIASQTIQTTLSGQNVQLNVYQKSTGLFIDVYSNNDLVIGGVVCNNQNLIVRDTYFGFAGDFAFVDNLGSTDPYYTGLGSQYSLTYLEPSDLADADPPLPPNIG
jgi:hypothetical protein